MISRKGTKTKKNKKLLSDRIVESFTIEPTPDVEDDLVFGTKPTTVTKEDFGSSDDDGDAAALSNFRKRNAALLSEISEKYAGEVANRERESDEEEESQSNSDDQDASVGDQDVSGGDEEVSGGDEEISGDDVEVSGSDQDDQDVSGSDQDDQDVSESDQDDDDDEVDISQLDHAKSDANFEHMKRVDESDELAKGKCTKNQLLAWENLLEMRIALQKCLVPANKMPLAETHRELKKESAQFANGVNKTKNSLTRLLNKMLELQSALLSQYPETKNILKENSTTAEDVNNDDVDDDNEEIPSDFDDSSDEKPAEEAKSPSRKRKYKLSKDLEERHRKFAKYRNATIQKWYDKTRVTVLNPKNKTTITSIVSQIEYLLNDKERLIRRTQLKRSNYDIVGCNVPESNSEEDRTAEEYCSEIYDDDDFYHQLLRELIEYKSSGVSDPIQLSRQWIALQQMRSKLKRKVDTRATKGRRIRYAVHNKLVNFMAPKRNGGEWTDESKDELFGSLFGKKYEA